MTTRIVTDPDPEPELPLYRQDGESLPDYAHRMLATARRYLGIDPTQGDAQ